ncbi:MAG: VWA domain-containing protein [Desulfuromonadaceae bacterium]|nr:VWA domain-containing protein [Desulfuromonadaceae bacterium]
MAENYGNTHQEINELAKDGTISNDTAKKYSGGTARPVTGANLNSLADDPLFLLVLVDASGSMESCKDAVIQSHPIMLESLRGSAHARHNRLLVCQYLFNSASNNLHPFTPLLPNTTGCKVTILNNANYNPSGRTALYKTLHSGLQDLLVTLSYAKKGGLAPECIIALITDGEDTEGGFNPTDIRNLLQELREQSILKNSVLLGLLNKTLTQERLETIQKNLGFEASVNCTQASEKEIRKAFRLFSQSLVAGI